MAPPTQKNLAPTNPEKYSLSHYYYEFYSYLEPFDHNQQMSDSAPPHSIPAAVLSNAFHEFAYIVGKLKICLKHFKLLRRSLPGTSYLVPTCPILCADTR